MRKLNVQSQHWLYARSFLNIRPIWSDVCIVNFDIGFIEAKPAILHPLLASHCKTNALDHQLW